MSFFKDFKEDLSQAVNELVSGEEAVDNTVEDDSDMVVNTLENDLDVESELSKLDGLLEKVTKDVKEPKPEEDKTPVIEAEPVETTHRENQRKNEQVSRGNDGAGYLRYRTRHRPRQLYVRGRSACLRYRR